MDKSLVVVTETLNGELTPASLECVEEGREIADRLGVRVRAILCGSGVAPLAQTLAAHGADAVTAVEHEALAQFSADGWLQALTPVLRDLQPALLLAPDSGQMRAWLPRLSARWHLPLVGCCIRVNIIGDGYPEVIRNTYGGACQERLIWPYATLVCALLIPGVRGVGAPRRDRAAELTAVRPELDPARFRDRTLRTLPADPRTVDLSEAERIVSGGFGVGGPNGMALLGQLAEQLKAALGGTRVAADRGWLETQRFIGSTGKIVAPKLYLAFGVSGAGQHLAGITDSECVIAVNSDRTAPMLQRADLAVVGDLHAILPILLDKLRALADTGPADPAALEPPAAAQPATAALEPVSAPLLETSP
ncbi:MAG: electron transfer flavoprotein subunit alpha/FixB family protein [Candidatus Competibacteraceae bacterium]|nr:electron transfer flavoprotein subunit alpha/FixB family protein [Candidatus Competibacteraceae bacterium]